MFAAGPREEFGQRLAGLIIEVWDDEERRAPLLALLRGSMTGELGAGMLRSILEQVLMPRLEQTFGASRPVAARAFAQMVGIMMARYVIRLEPLASASRAEMSTLIAPIIQGVVDSTTGPAGPQPGAGPPGGMPNAVPPIGGPEG
nr:hypothetical protein [Kineosporia babensis]